MKYINSNKIKYRILLTAVFVSLLLNSNQKVSAQEPPKYLSGADSTNVEIVIPGTSIKTNKLMSPLFNSYVTGEQISTPTANVNNMLFGRIPGLYVSESNAEPGFDAADLKIRGLSTYNNSSIPVYVDGFQTNESFFQYLSLYEIESIEILKDATALAPFGLRGANGAIWITTKRGKIGDPRISMQVRSGIQQPVNINKPVGTPEYVRFYNEARSNDNNNTWLPYYNESESNLLPNVDWYNEVLKKASNYSDVDVSVNGGDKIARYFVLFGYMGQNGLYDIPINDTLSNVGISRFNLRTNIDITPSPYLEAKLDLGARIENRHFPNRSGNSLWNDLAKYPSLIYPVKNADSTWTGTPVYNNNPVASITSLGRRSTHDRTFQANFRLKEKLDFLVKGLYLSQGMSHSNWTRDGAGNTRNYARYIDGVQQTTDNDSPYTRSEDSGQGQWYWQHYTATAGYDRSFEKSTISSSFGVLYNIYKTDFSTNGDAGEMTEYKHLNLSGGINYAYDNRYVGTFTFAESGSDNYRPGNQWGFYPSLAVGWVVSNEDFLKENSTFNFLKITSSVGKNGWDPMSENRFLWQKYYEYQGGWNTGDGTPSWNSGLTLMYIPNPDIFAEKSMKYDFRVDLKLFDKLKLNLDLFTEKRSDIVTRNWFIPGAAGITDPPYENIGKVTNKGFEIEASWSGKLGIFSYFINGMAGYNINRIDYMAEVVTLPNIARTGRSISSMFGYIAEGFYDVSDFDGQGNLLEGLSVPTFGHVQPGDIKYKDLTNDMIIDENDQTLIGNYLPKMQYSFTLGLQYRGFDISALIHGISGRDVSLMGVPIQTIAFRDNGNIYEIASGRWAYYPDQNIDTRNTAQYPRLSLLDNNNNYLNSTLWTKNGDYIKLRSLELGYSFSPKALKLMGISKARISLIGINLLTFSELLQKYNMDPDALSGYPSIKSYNIGLNITF